MVTGGFRRKQAMEEALTNGADIIGIGRPMCVMTDAPNQLFAWLAELPRYESELIFFRVGSAFLIASQPFAPSRPLAFNIGTTHNSIYLDSLAKRNLR